MSDHLDSLIPASLINRESRELLDARCKRAMLIGLAAYLLNILEPWLRFPDDPVRWKIQIITATVIAITFSLYFTPYGKRHPLALVTTGLMIGAAGFEAVVCVPPTQFRTDYSDGFPVLFAFYTVFIPTTARNTVFVGISLILVLAVPEVLMTGDPTRLVTTFVSDATTFAILLSGRIISNASWEREFVANRSRLQFVEEVSHEFKNTVTAISTSATILAKRNVTHDTATTIASLRGASDRLTRLVKDLLALGPLDAGVKPPTWQNIDPHEFVQRVTREFEGDAASRNSRVHLELGADLPLLQGDPSSVRSILWNLLENAAKYSPEDSPIEVRVSRKRSWVLIEVQDKGYGIPKNERKQIFHNYFRGKAALQSKIPGTGIGLALATRFVIAHNGRIQLKSSVGRGSTFIVSLPGVK